MTTAPNRTTYTPLVLKLWRWLRESYRKNTKRRADVALDELLPDHERAVRRSHDPTAHIPPMRSNIEWPPS
jgi:hypothetical protein